MKRSQGLAAKLRDEGRCALHHSSSTFIKNQSFREKQRLCPYVGTLYTKQGSKLSVGDDEWTEMADFSGRALRKNFAPGTLITDHFRAKTLIAVFKLRRFINVEWNLWRAEVCRFVTAFQASSCGQRLGSAAERFWGILHRKESSSS